MTLARFVQGEENLSVMLGKQRPSYEKQGIGYNSQEVHEYKNQNLVLITALLSLLVKTVVLKVTWIRIALKETKIEKCGSRKMIYLPLTPMDPEKYGYQKGKLFLLDRYVLKQECYPRNGFSTVDVIVT